jgi:hypothetical protein
MEVVIEVAPGKTTRGWPYTEAALQKLVQHVQERTLSGGLGHQREEDHAHAVRQTRHALRWRAVEGRQSLLPWHRGQNRARPEALDQGQAHHAAESSPARRCADPLTRPRFTTWSRYPSTGHHPWGEQACRRRGWQASAAARWWTPSCPSRAAADRRARAIAAASRASACPCAKRPIGTYAELHGQEPRPPSSEHQQPQSPAHMPSMEGMPSRRRYI